MLSQRDYRSMMADPRRSEAASRAAVTRAINQRRRIAEFNRMQRLRNPESLEDAFLAMNKACDEWLRPDGTKAERELRYREFCTARESFKRLLIKRRAEGGC